MFTLEEFIDLVVNVFLLIQISIHGCVYNSPIAFYSIFFKNNILNNQPDSSMNEPF